ncbi:MAG: dihydroorotase [Haliscomenobacter sp.]|nr:dihydroorotase [Haliscomenobacter sp.]MBK9488962.1 dihydroorotase [Haliscomenobacter sp.]
MNFLLRKATVIDSNSPYHGKVVDIFIEGDKITSIGSELKRKADQVIEIEGIHVSPGWVDIGVQVGDPGFEHREDLRSVSAAAASGGFTAIGAQPNTYPVVDGKTEVAYLVQHSRGKLVDILPIAAITAKCQGKDITEMIDMHHAGAIAFSDGNHAIADNGMILRALEYVKAFDGIVINQPLDRTLAFEGQMHEGVVSTSLGMKGIPNLAEDLMVQRDIYLTQYAESRLHLANLSSQFAVELVRRAKAKGLKISCSVAALNLAFDDRALVEFDSNYKVLPPLRSHEDIEALKQGLKDGTIDLIGSNHVPLEEEAKKLEFPYADFGAIGLETTYALVNTHLEGVLSQTELVEKLAINPRRIFNLEEITVREGAKANLTVFHPHQTWTFERSHIFSKSGNSPLLGKRLKGKVIGVVNNGSAFINPH